MRREVVNEETRLGSVVTRTIQNFGILSREFKHRESNKFFEFINLLLKFVNIGHLITLESHHLTGDVASMERVCPELELVKINAVLRSRGELRL